jgi:hypothetical protein
MNINVKGMFGGAARVAAGAALLVAAGSAMAPAHAAGRKNALISSSTGGTGPGPLLSTYFDLGQHTYGNDDVVRLTNVAGVPACAFIYVFDTDQELAESCAVGLSPNKALSFSVRDGLTQNPAFGNFFNNDVGGIIEIISGTANTGSSVFANPGSGTEAINCDPAGTITPLTAVNAYIETSVVVESYGDYLPGATVLEFTNDGDPDATNLATIQSALGVLGSEIGSSGKGICTTDPWTMPPTNTGAVN